METNKRLRIMRTTLALDVLVPKTIVTLPIDAILTVLPGVADGGKMVSVLWDGRELQMFAIDLAMRGVEIRAHAAAS